MSEYAFPVDRDRARRIAAARMGSGATRGYRTIAPVGGTGADADYVGACGELAFSAWSGLPVSPSHPEGDGGTDFTTPSPHFSMPLTLDTKTYRKPKHLLVPEAAVRAHLYVLCGLKEPPPVVTLIGWAWDFMVRRWPVDPGGPGARFPAVRRNHYAPASDLWPIPHLGRVLGLTPLLESGDVETPC